MFSNIHIFLGPLPIGIPSHWLLAVDSVLPRRLLNSASSNRCWSSWHSGGSGWSASIAEEPKNAFIRQTSRQTAKRQKTGLYTVLEYVFRHCRFMQSHVLHCSVFKVLHFQRPVCNHDYRLCSESANLRQGVLPQPKNKNLASRSRISLAHDTSRASIGLINYPVSLKSKFRVIQGHWKRNYWIDNTRLTSSRVIWRRMLSWPWNVG